MFLMGSYIRIPGLQLVELLEKVMLGGLDALLVGLNHFFCFLSVDVMYLADRLIPPPSLHSLLP